MKNIRVIIVLLMMFAYSIMAYAIEVDFGGIGAALYKDRINKKLIITNVIPNSPAEYIGLPIGGVIQQINGEKTKDISLDRATSLIRGEVGTKVNLIIKYNGKSSNYTVTRAKITVPKEKIDERYILHWKQVVPNGLEKVERVHPDVYKVLSKQEQAIADIRNYWLAREIRFKNGYDACMSYQESEQNSCLQNLVNREITQTENDRQAELQETMIQQQANQNFINNMNQTIMNNSLRDINSSIRNNSNQLNNINNTLRGW